MNMYRKLILLLLLCMPLSCGFHLRGSIDLPPGVTPLYVDLYSVDNDLSRELRLLLSQTANNKLANTKEEAVAELKIISAKSQRRVIAVDNRGRVRQYELDYRVKYSVVGKTTSATGVESAYEKTRDVRLKRDLSFDPDSVLAIDHEQEKLYEDMRKDAALRILQQLKSMGQQSTKE